MKIKICADSTCDLSPELVEKYDVGIIPLYIVWFGFPVLLFGFIAWLTKNIWVVWGMVVFVIIAVLYAISN